MTNTVKITLIDGSVREFVSDRSVNFEEMITSGVCAYIHKGEKTLIPLTSILIFSEIEEE